MCTIKTGTKGKLLKIGIMLNLLLMSNFAICNLLLLTLVFGCVRVEEKSHESTSKRPNVLMIVVDDMNGYGLKDQYPLVQIPYLDKLRSESVNFVNAACNTPGL